MPKCRSQYKDQEKLRLYMNRHRKKNYKKTQLYPRRVWKADELDEILKHEISDRELSKKLKRSVQSIQVKRCKLKKENEE